MKDRLFVVINRSNLFFMLVFTTVFMALSQQAGIKGVILDSATNHPIEFADITIQSIKDSTVVSGGITNEKGIYQITNIPVGKYHIHFSFMGYQRVSYQKILLEKGIRSFGVIKLKISSENLKEVVIKTGKPAITYKVDKKVINASSFPSATVAMNLLENVPSIQVDIDGKLTYRNDGVFIVLINGKRVSNGADRLKQIPAKQIDKIEIITNPSAKYSAEGTAGIINVVLKRNRLKGFVINSSISSSTNGRYAWSFNVSKNTKKSGWYVNGNVAKYVNWDGTTTSNIKIYHNDETIERKIDGARKKTFNNGYIDIGYNYDITSKDEIELSFNINPMVNKENSKIRQTVVEDNYQNNVLTNSKQYYINSNTHTSYSYFGPSLSFKHKFNKEGTRKYELNASYSAYLQSFFEKQENEVIENNNVHKEGHLYHEENEKMIDLDFSFTYPINKKYIIEAGVNVITDYIPKTTIQNGTFDAQAQLTPFAGKYKTQNINFMRNVFAGFVTFKGKFNKWSYKLGLRNEFTDRISDFSYTLTDSPSVKHNIPASKQFNDVFPSLNLMYSFSDSQQVSASYSRRINRPNYFKLMPLREYDSPYQYTIGNADLQPYYANSYEISYINSWNKDYVSVEIFGKQSYNISTYINEIDDEGKIYLVPRNFGTSFSFGSVLSGNYHITSWWNSNLSLSLYQYTMYIRTENINKDKSTFNSNIKFNHTFKLPKSFGVRLNMTYNSPSISAQSEGSAFFTTKMSVKKNFGKHWSAVVYTNHIFGNIVRERTIKTPNLIIENTQSAYQYFGFIVSYKFNNRK
jgi:outer membrane receptor protein involved in Fe transport